MTQDVTPHQRWVEWEQRRGKGSSLGARSGDGPTHKVKRPIFRCKLLVSGSVTRFGRH